MIPMRIKSNSIFYEYNKHKYFYCKSNNNYDAQGV